MQGGHVHIVVHHIDQHQGQEADQEGDEDGQHHLGQPEVLLPLGRGNTVLFTRVSSSVFLDIESRMKEG